MSTRVLIVAAGMTTLLLQGCPKKEEPLTPRVYDLPDDDLDDLPDGDLPDDE